ncbi:MAG: DUF1289 domain-containing protein [Gammaproteobacteria bacterium]|nr:DUF1289 domain-containing protein [Gammaproteobacteria bacterium]
MNHRRTPCVGICSTTYGDLVCRGCKRFAHEIVQWNGFADDQQDRIWERLQDLRSGAVDSIVRIKDTKRLLASAISLNVPDADKHSQTQLAYEVLRRMPSQGLKLDAVGLAAISDGEFESNVPDSGKILKQIEGEFYQRSLAVYEHNFKIPVQ